MSTKNVKNIGRWSLVRNEKPIVLYDETAIPTSEKSEAIALCEEMPVIPVSMVVDTKI
jgi:hypothetical protein